MRHQSALRLAAIAAIALAVTLSPRPSRDASASGTGYVLVNVVDTNDAAPGGGTYLGFGGDVGVRVSNSPEVVFWATTGIDQGVFADGGGGAGRVVALAGDVAPGTGGGTFGPHFRPNINDAGDVAFWVDITGGEGIFVASQGGTTNLVLTGDAAPGTPDGVFDALGGPAAINADGDVLFQGASRRVPYPNYYAGLYVVSSGGITEVASGLNASFVAGNWSLADDGTAAFLSNGVKIGPPTGSVAQVGDPAPGTEGGTFSGFGDGLLPTTNNSHEVAFFADISGGTSTEGTFVSSGGSITAVALSGQSAPGGGSLTWGLPPHQFGAPVINNGGDLAFRANAVGGGTCAIFVASGGTISCAASPGELAPDTGGGTLSLISEPDMNDSGEVAFLASIYGGNATGGIFLALPSKGDSDADGLPNAYEADESRPCLDPLVADGGADPDADGLANVGEFGEGSEPCTYDTDGEGCSDGEEVGLNPRLGGMRSPLNFWDFMDQWIAGSRDKAVSGGDIAAVIARYGSVGSASGDPLVPPVSSTGYHVIADRNGSIPGLDPWDLNPPNGSISGGDIGAVVVQFGHSCAGPP